MEGSTVRPWRLYYLADSTANEIIVKENMTWLPITIVDARPRGGGVEPDLKYNSVSRSLVLATKLLPLSPIIDLYLSLTLYLCISFSISVSLFISIFVSISVSVSFLKKLTHKVSGDAPHVIVVKSKRHT
jgi:hypothetical protein